jgi:DNA-binding CsgD family transcriptional regulator
MATIRELGQRNIVLRSLREGIDTSNATGRMVAGVLASSAELELELGRERKRPTSGWAALTRAELDVVRLVSEGFGNKDIATRLFVSPRTVQTHLTHVYTKLGLTSRVQLAQEAARHT